MVLRHSWIPGRNFPWSALCFSCCVPVMPLEVRESSTTTSLESERASLFFTHMVFPCRVLSKNCTTELNVCIFDESWNVVCVCVCVCHCVCACLATYPTVDFPVITQSSASGAGKSGLRPRLHGPRWCSDTVLHVVKWYQIITKYMHPILKTLARS